MEIAQRDPVQMTQATVLVYGHVRRDVEEQTKEYTDPWIQEWTFIASLCGSSGLISMLGHCLQRWADTSRCESQRNGCECQ